jgi:hypothetical protein
LLGQSCDCHAIIKNDSKNRTLNYQTKLRSALQQRTDGYIEFRKKKIETNGRREKRQLG